MRQPRHPLQPFVLDDQGIRRFKANAIVQFLLEHGGYDLNDLARRSFSNEDREQFAQLIGYSRCGFEDLPYVSDETWTLVRAQAKRHDREPDVKRILNRQKAARAARTRG